MIRFLRELWHFLEPQHRRRGVGIIVLMIFNAILDFFNLAFFLPLIFIVIQPELTTTNQVVQHLYHWVGASSQGQFIIMGASGILLFTIIKTFIGSRIASAKATYAFSVASSLSSRAIAWFTSRAYHDYTKSDYSKALNLIANHPLAFGNNIVIPVATILSESIVLLLIVGSIAIFDLKILVFLTLIFLPLGLLFIYRKRALRKIKEIIKERYPASLKHILQLIEGYPEVRSYQKEKYFTDQYQRTHHELTQAFTRDHVLQTSTTRITEVLTAVLICGLIVYAVISQFPHEQMILLLSVYASASFRVIPSLNRILLGLQQMHTHEYLMEELVHVQQSVAVEKPIMRPTFASTIELRNIAMEYPDGPSILKQTDLIIQKGSKSAIIGKSGEGKTTLLLILLGFAEPNEGEILIDGKISAHGLKGVAAYVPQSPYILDGSLAENIAFGEEKIDHAKISRITKEMDLETLIAQLPQGIHTRVGEKGVKLSGGQRQRIALARALYADAEVLLLDEVTNQVNHSVELEILKALDFLSHQGKTIIMVTHKIAQQDFFDKIYKLENMKFTEMMMHTEP